MSAASYNYDHYNLPFSHMIVRVTISDGDMLSICYYNIDDKRALTRSEIQVKY